MIGIIVIINIFIYLQQKVNIVLLLETEILMLTSTPLFLADIRILKKKI